MTEYQLANQIKRLKEKWPNNFDSETMRRIWFHCKYLSKYDFERVCDRMLDTRPKSRPPLPLDFLEQSKKLEKMEFHRSLKGAVDAINNNIKTDHYGNRVGLQNFLDKNYPGCKTVLQAVEEEKRRQRNGDPRAQDLNA